MSVLTSFSTRILDNSIDADYSSPERRFQGIPGIERSPKGRLWATWYAGPTDEPGEGPNNYVILVNSGDDGQTWSKPMIVINPPGEVRAFDPCLWLDPLNRLWLFWAQSLGRYDNCAGIWAMVTEQPDQTKPLWSQPKRLSHGIMMNKPLALSSGEWLLPAALWNHLNGREVVVHTQPPPEDRLAFVIASLDQGASWQRRGGVDIAHRSYDENMLIERRSGELWMLVRTFYGIGESTSVNGGITWSTGRPTDIPHVDSRFFIRRLHSGRLLLVTHNPPDRKTRSHLTAWLSDDDGLRWYGGLMIDGRVGVSYPDATQSADGQVYLIYDFERTGARQILMAVFTEDDIAAKHWTSPGSRQRVIVDQAGDQSALLTRQ